MPECNTPEARADQLRLLAQDFAATALPQLRSIARRTGTRDELLDDVVQQGLYAFLRSYPGEVSDRAGAYSYLARAVQTSALHAARSERRHQRRLTAARAHLGSGGGVDPLDVALAADDVERKRRLLEALPDDERTVAFLGAVGYAPHEIADLLGVSRRRVRKLVTRGNAHLREIARE